MGAIPIDHHGVAFRVWAPNADAVSVVGTFNDWNAQTHPLVREEHGTWYGVVPNATIGHEYRYHLRNGDQAFDRVDPRVRKVTNSAGNGIVWLPNPGGGRGERGAFTPPTQDQLVIYELHIGTFNATPGQGPGTFASAMEKLPYLRDLGINAVELMPVAEFAGDFSWGYNPAHAFAVESAYGGPEGLLEFVRSAHDHGIAVIMDVVYNHFGPGDLSLWQFDGWNENGGGGIYFYNDWRAETPWGATRPDYGRGEVRSFLRDNARMWLADYGIDGLRWDMSLYIRTYRGNPEDPTDDAKEGWGMCQWIHEELRKEFPGVITIAEDMRHSEWIVKPTGAGGAGFGAQWDAAFVHPVRDTLIVAEDEQRDLDRVIGALRTRYDGDAFKRVIYSESHDEVANGKARIPTEISPDDPTHHAARKRAALGIALVLTAPGIPMLFQGQEFIEDGWFRDDAGDQGLARIALYAYYSKVFALSPRLDWASGRPNPDAHARDSTYVALNGEAPMQPVGMARGTGMTQNEALVIYRDGLLGIAGTQTSRKGSDRPFPGLKFPEHKVPTGIAITTQNEFALVTIWDTEAVKGQLAVIALEGKHIPFHTMPYMGLANQGSWSAFKLLGYVDLPMAAPSSVSAASNGYWNGPSQTSGKGLGAIVLSDDDTRESLKRNRLVATGGYAIVASKQEDKVAIIDLTPLFNYMRRSYLESGKSFDATIAARGAEPRQFPQTFAISPGNRPTVVWQGAFAEPTAVLAGHRLDRWSKDRHKAYVATQSGTIHIVDTSSIMWRSSWEFKGTLGVIGTFSVGANPVSMTFARRAEKDLPLIPKNSNSGIADSFNSVFWVAVRGEAAVKAVHTYQGKGQVHMTIRDRRMGDPVAVSTAVRGPILTVADFTGKKILSFRIGPIYDARNKVNYGAGADGNDPFEFAGELALPGKPFLVGSANVN